MAKNDIFTRAKRIREKHPRMEWQAAVKQAGKSPRAGAVGAVKGHKKKAANVGKSKRRVGSVKQKYKCIHEVRKVAGISYKGGSVQVKGVESVDRKKGELQALLGQQAGWLDVAISSAKTSRERKALTKKKREVLAELRKVSK